MKTIYRSLMVRWRNEICQSQPVKMPRRPLRLLTPIIIYLRVVVKREDIININLLSRDDDFLISHWATGWRSAKER
jgi:hypothetical protein